MSKLQPVRGTHDILPEESRRTRHVVDTAREMSERYGFGEISTPIFEFTDVFKRTLGDTSDVVTKEMYTFEDRGGEELTLRPEYTAGIARAFISGGLRQHAPLKFFGHGPMFRYERPQKGRLRQFHQIDAEIIGVAGPQADIEVIALGADILRALGVLGLTTLELNTLGDVESRNAYRLALVDYFGGHVDKLSDDSKIRLEKNPMRILDSKSEGDRVLVADAPRMSEYMNAASQDFFGAVREGLDNLGVTYTLNEKLVRGLDYYTHTAFEFTTTELGSQGAVIAGGRYDGLIETMGGPSTPGIGWAGGIERLSMLATAEISAPRPVSVIPIGAASESIAMKVAHDLRQAGFVIDMGFAGNPGKRMKRANGLNAKAAVMLGEDEIAKGVATVRDLASGEQQEVTLDALVSALEAYR
ncbi:MAG: histidine--tRNA ligase [Alphaproteobacteria bacterium]|nr:histidine--tRNA ligase [Alphaproteobacteria bacterium]MBT4017346.1 histidine--tRNA ligase [Alphaproteobacteria bacterium]MBT4966858.1 histidine--tRNA ligase [Alphaproteobacteria bacterium]MBT5158802.1 histidine--tRNA ligase [Alphaproteobacteria bacterium]MBT6387380.1 histidine--tRNA ligase [Alphaproteobacteria bacterium]